MNWFELLLSTGVVGGVAGLLGSLIGGLLQRPKVKADAVKAKADAVDALTNAALKQVDELQERTRDAEQAAKDARQQVRLLSVEIDRALATLRTWRAAILSPAADLERLREMVRAETGPATNGRPL
ncbi:MAG TPA: hypothetical protein VFR67_05985 [Pilimelia sp.]|nr:hypothetical protein [Pilimelia sp.]